MKRARVSRDPNAISSRIRKLIWSLAINLYNNLPAGFYGEQ